MVKPNKNDKNGQARPINTNFDQIFYQSPIGILLYDKNGKLTNANDSALKIARIPKLDDVLDTNLFDNPKIDSKKEYLHEKGLIKFQDTLDLIQIKEQNIYNPIESKIIDIDWTVSITDSGYMVQIQDITDIIKAEKKNRMVLDSIVETYAEFDNEWRYVDVNSHIEEIYNMNRNELIGKVLWDVFPQLVGSKECKMFYKAKKENVPVRFESKSLVTGEWFETNAYPHPDGLSVYSHNINDRKKAEIILVRSNQKISEIMESIQENLYVLDYDWNYVHINKQSAAAIGVEPKDFIGQNHWKMFPKYRGTVLEDNFRDAMEKREVRQFEIYSPYNDNWFIVTVYPSSEGITVLGSNITERKKAEEKTKMILESIAESYFEFDNEWRYLDVNDKSQEILGLKKNELIGKVTWELFPQLIGSKQYKEFHRAKKENIPVRFETKSVATGEWFETNAYPHQEGLSAYSHNITDRKNAELERETSNEFLKLLNESDNIYNLIHSAINFFWKQSGCEAVGIRLKEGEDYPYYETKGFSKDFIKLENNLCLYNKYGNTKIDSKGYPIMECMCGNVICGRFDPSQPFFTNNGSFWTNNTTKLLATSSEDDRQARTRNRCNGEGYESIALIPLISGTKKLGLLQLNDRRKNLFNPELITVWERLTGYLSVALAKFQADEHKQQLLENEQQLTEELQSSNEELQSTTEELYKSNEELHKSSKLLSTIYELNPDAIVLTTVTDSKIIDCNQEYLNQIGYTRDEVIGRTSLELNLISPEERETYINTTREKEATSNYEGKVTRKDGSYIYVLYSTKLITIDNQQVVLNIGRDVTKSRRIKKTLQESEERFRNLADNIPNLAWMADASGWIFWYNQQWYEYTGTTLEEMQGWGWQKVHHPDYVDSITEEWSTHILEGKPYDNIFPLKGKDGNYRWFLTRITPIKNEQGKLIRWFGTNTDITDRKNFEEDLQTTMVKLKQSNKELEQFAYITSHDLREPLRMITSFLQLLERRYKGQLDKDAHEFIGFAVDGAKRLDSMTNDLLQYSKISSLKRETAPVDFEHVLEHAISNLKLQIEENNAIITHDPLPTINGDEHLKIQLFQNIIANAIKYRSQETPKIHISATQEKNQYLFSIKDNGIGMSLNHLEKIFTIFQRLHTHEEYEGTGIGLAIAQKIVHQQGGQIWAESEPGKGSTFYFTIPIE